METGCFVLLLEFVRHACFPRLEHVFEFFCGGYSFEGGLFGGFDGAEAFVDLALDDGEPDPETEEICIAQLAGKTWRIVGPEW